MVDRKDLEEQIERDFAFLEIPIERVGFIKQLIEFLSWGKQGKRGIFLVTIEKFNPKEFTQLEKEGQRIELTRENIIVLADEVHRTHYGKFSTMMRSVFKNAFIFGFTGTPLYQIERNTFQKFCLKDEIYLDRYSMLDAIDDGFTVPLSYQARLPHYHANKQELKDFTRFEEEEIKFLSSEEQRVLRKKVRVIKAYVKKPERIEAIAKDLAEHFQNIVEPTDLKAMLVTIDRETCVLYKNALDNHLPPETSEIVITFSSKDRGIIRDYYFKLQQKYSTTDVKEIHQKIIEDFKTKEKPKILIVTDMLITGFDAPILWNMYLDKPLKEHRILQAIARTNRPYQNKQFGMIVDYIGAISELEEALAKFEARDAKDLRIVIRDLKKELESFVDTLQETLEIFQNVKLEDIHESLENALDLLIDPETAREFETLISKLMKLYEMLKGGPELRDYLDDYTTVTKLYIAYNKKFKRQNVDELKIENLSKKTIRLIQEIINVTEIENRYTILDIDEDYINFLKRNPPKTTGGAIEIPAILLKEARSQLIKT